MARGASPRSSESEGRTSPEVAGARKRLRERLRAATRGPWRVKIVEGSMVPAIAPGDWLMVDPTVQRWPGNGSIVLFREPESGELAIKRVTARPGESVRFAGGFLVLGPDEAWLTADADAMATAQAGFGPPIDSNRFGPVPLDLLVGRVLFRYGPPSRIGRIAGPVPDR